MRIRDMSEKKGRVIRRCAFLQICEASDSIKRGAGAYEDGVPGHNLSIRGRLVFPDFSNLNHMNVDTSQ